MEGFREEKKTSCNAQQFPGEAGMIVPGRRIGRYEIIEEIGKGGMGTVFKAMDPDLERIVAIKVLKSIRGEGTGQIDRFLREARAAARLSSPNVVTVHEVNTDGDIPFISMEYVEGVSLRKFMKKSGGSLEIETAVQIMCQIFDAVEAAHNQGILHRDLKPDNVVIGENGIAKVMDFGIAKFTGQSSTETQEVVGTATYMSPEQCTGRPADQRSDIYSLGVVMYELLTGRPPFEADNVVALIHRKLNDCPPHPSELGCDIPGRIEGAVMKALEKDPELRHKTVADFKRAIQDQNMKSSERSHPVLTSARARGKKQFQCHLVGREQESKLLSEALERAVLKEGRTVVVSGEAGVGKSRLLEEIQSLALCKGFAILEGSCLYRETAAPYFPFISAIRGYFERETGAGKPEDRERIKNYIREEIPELRIFVPFLGTVVRSKTSGILRYDSWIPDVQGGKERIFDAISELIERTAELAPTAIFLDDLQWIDASSLQLFHYISRNTRKSRVLIVAAFRPEDLGEEEGEKIHPLIQTLQRMNVEGLYEKIELQRLSREQSFEMIRELLKNVRFTDDFRDLLYVQTMGNPLFLVEVLKAMKEEGILKLVNGVWQCTKAPRDVGMPPKIKDAVERRVMRLDPAERSVLECGSVQGKFFSSDVVAAILKMDRIELLRRLQNLERSHQIIRFDGKSYTFDHPLIWEGFYNSISEELRSEYHLMIGSWLEEKYRSDPTPVSFELADHFYKGGDYEKALPYLEKAAEKAQEVFAYEEALNYYGRALAIRKRNIETKEELQNELKLRRQIGSVCTVLGEWERALDAYEQARDLSSAFDDKTNYCYFTKLIGDVEFYRRNWEGARVLYDEALRILEKEGNRLDIANICLSKGNVEFENGDLDATLSLYTRALEIGEALSDAKLVARACNNLGATMNVLGDREKAIWYYGRSLENYRFAADRFGEAQTFHNIGMTYAELRNWNEASSFYKKSLEASRQMRDAALESITSLALGEVCAREGQLDKAIELCERALAVFARRDDRLGIGDGYRVMGIIKTKQKLYDEAENLFRESIVANEGCGSQLQLAEVLREYGSMLGTKGDAKGARELLGRALEIFSNLKAKESAAEVDRILSTVGSEKAFEEVLGG
ncbi:MAG: tetratricopeptide repeat protein [Candidatus Eisenbacteria bacterium]|nr:tetratricopeptide repeat protein [Candidatus Eisenbacteria bacterium]